MADVSKIKLPNNSVVNIKDARITGVDTTPTSGSMNVVTSGGVYTALDRYVVGDGVISIVSLSRSAYEALATKDPTTVYIVSPDKQQFVLSGTGTQDDPIVGWYENVASVINPNGIANGNLSGSLPGVYNFFSNVLPDQYFQIYFSYNGSTQVIKYSGGYLYTNGSRCFNVFNTDSKQLGNVRIYEDDSIVFHLEED